MLSVCQYYHFIVQVITIHITTLPSWPTKMHGRICHI